MPIRPENRDRYPENWDEISASIKFGRAGGRCECTGECGRPYVHLDVDERCRNRHGHPAYGTGAEVVLTTAHLTSATQLPVDLHVTGATEANEVVQLVGLLVPLDAERLEGLHMMHHRALAEFVGTAPAGGARFVVALESGTTGWEPCGSVGVEVAARPEWVVLTRWRLSREPHKTTDVSAEPPSGAEVVARHGEVLATLLAGARPESALGSAHQFTATGFRAGADVIRRLLRRDGDYIAADGALDRLLAAPGHTPDPGPLDSQPLPRHQGSPARFGAGLPWPPGVVGEVVPTFGAAHGQGAQSRSCHGSAGYHLGYIPENCDPANLKAMCPGCHLHYDRDHHRETRAATRRAELDDHPGLFDLEPHWSKNEG